MKEEREQRQPEARPAPEEIARWKAEHGEVYEIGTETEDGRRLAFIFKKPGRVALSHFARTATKDTLKALNNLVFDCLLWPSADQVRAIMDEKPGYLIGLGGKLQELTGLNEDFFAGRL